MSKLIRNMGKREEERKKKEVIDLLQKQIVKEEALVRLYNDKIKVIKSAPVRHLLHMIQLDSMKHIDICQFAIENLQGEDVLREEKGEIIGVLKPHIKIEEESVDAMNKILKNEWIKENKGLSELIKRLRDDEKRHHKALKKLVDKTFFRIDPHEFVTALRSPDFIEERYRRIRDYKKKEEMRGQ
jgi:rubrerythrin